MREIMNHSLKKYPQCGDTTACARTIRAGNNGTKKLKAEHGWRLIKVRYYYDEAKKVTFKMVELIVNYKPYKRNPKVKK